MKIDELERARIFILKRLGILKFLSVIESLLVMFLAFIFIKDLIIALILGVFICVFFYRITSKKLKNSLNNLEEEVLSLFLRQNNAKINKKAILLKDFESLNLSEKLNEFNSLKPLIFENFSLCDIKFKDDKKRFFCGVLIQSKLAKKEFKNEESIYQKLNKKEFDMSAIFGFKGNYLIASMQNPFFINLKEPIKVNLIRLQERLSLIKQGLFD
ncbi:poly(A) polymerase [Campylobacter sp. LR196d]|uniref:poly(A) polymerase n=1 Tax=Campylobacter sp. LR196d TaxID=2593543 RepID=UPI001238F493|nr:poly(A) polymerase [Campylobacter sp. LR196d]KAA6225201.1 poly(A) polymerase [Campylobacter sp. LR196d]